MQSRHTKSLAALLRFDGPLTDLQERLRDLPYNHSGEAMVMTKAHMMHALRRYIDGDITARDLETWADLVEGRPSIEYGAGCQKTLKNTIFQLSTPDINEPITAGLCWRHLKELNEGHQY